MQKIYHFLGLHLLEQKDDMNTDNGNNIHKRIQHHFSICWSEKRIPNSVDIRKSVVEGVRNL